MVRDTVGSDATPPNSSGSARSNAISARQSPPNASDTARSISTFAGSCLANGDRHADNPADSSRPSPDTRTVSVSSTPPADDTTPLPAVSTRTDG
jgi:hypothetical protein